MPIDVITRIYNNQSTMNGSVVAGATVKGAYASLDPVKNQGVPASGIAQRLDDRFNDPTYYTA